jgi:hypothetical protein
MKVWTFDTRYGEIAAYADGGNLAIMRWAVDVPLNLL